MLFGKQTPGSRPECYAAYGDHHRQNQLSAAAAATASSHADAHGVVDRTAEKADFYNQQQQHETRSTDNRVYERTALNCHGHYIASSYSALCDAYPGSTDHQMDYTQCVRSGVSYSPSAYGETILGRASSLNGVIQPVEPFTSYRLERLD